jgi:hypothetical protein
MKEQATPRKLAALLSAKTGMSERDLRTRVQYLREGGLQPGGEFGDSKAPRLTLKAAAIQILGLTAPVQIAVASHVRRVGALKYDPAHYANPEEFAGSGVEEVLPLLRGETFLSAVVSLLLYMTRREVGPLDYPVKGIGVIESADHVQAWIEPRMSQAWKDQLKAPQRIYFGSPSVRPLDVLYAQERSLNAAILYEAAQLFRRGARRKGDEYAEEVAPRRPTGGGDNETEPQRIQRAREAGAA